MKKVYFVYSLMLIFLGICIIKIISDKSEIEEILHIRLDYTQGIFHVYHHEIAHGYLYPYVVYIRISDNEKIFNEIISKCHLQRYPGKDLAFYGLRSIGEVIYIADYWNMHSHESEQIQMQIEKDLSWWKPNAKINDNFSGEFDCKGKFKNCGRMTMQKSGGYIYVIAECYP